MTFFRPFSELNALGEQHNTNKARRFIQADGTPKEWGEGMLVRYEFFLSHLRRNGVTRVLELGAGVPPDIGASCRVWKAYFPDAEIHVADINPDVRQLEEEGITVHVGDLGQIDFLRRLAGQEYDLIVDDASHLWSHQILAFRHLFPRVRSGGVYIAEDLCTSFGDFVAPFSQGLDMRDAVSYFLALSRICCWPHGDRGHQDITSIYRLTGADHALAQSLHMMCWTANACICIRR